METRISLPRYRAQFWRRHPFNADWVQALEDSACAEMHKRVFRVTDFWPSSFLKRVSCSVGPISRVEASLNGRAFAFKAFSAFEFRVTSADLDGLDEYLNNNQPDDMEKFGAREFPMLWISGELMRFSEIILFILNLTYAGVISTEVGIAWIGRKAVLDGSKRLSGVDRSAASFHFLTDGISGHPQFDKILQWSKRCGGIWTGPARTNVEKAVSFLSHTFGTAHRVDDAASLLWATAGLEALACDNSSSVSAQLRKRLPALCTRIPFNNIDRSVRDAYDFRSRLFHGDIPIHNAFNEEEESALADRYDNKLYEYGQMLKLMLIDAIWECAEKDAAVIRFADVAHFS